MYVGLLPLLPKNVQFRERNFRLLKDRHIFDTESIALLDTTKSYFVSMGTKRKSQAIFTGDFSLVKEANLFLPIQLQALPRYAVARAPLALAEFPNFWNLGAFQWNVTVPETVCVDEDRLAAIWPGPEVETMVNTAYFFNGGRHYADRRTYLVGANKVIPGGRAIEFTVNWQETAGNGLVATALDLSIVFAGGEYEPGGSGK